MVTAKESDADHILGLEVGADDYLVKPVPPRLLMARVKAHLRRAGRIRYTGRTHDANKLVHIMPLYTAFVCEHVDYFREMYGYEQRRATPGQKGRIFAPFRDTWLPRALRELRAELSGVPVDKVDATAYLLKRNQRLNKNAPCMQAIVGWEWTTDDAHGAGVTSA